MDNYTLARLLRTVAAAYAIKGENRFKIIAYERAADSVEHSTIEIKDLWDQGKLDAVPGIGQAIASHLDELFRTGRVKHFEEVRCGLPAAMFALLEIPGFGPQKAYKLAKSLRIGNSKNPIEELLKAAQEHRIAKIDGFGEASEREIIKRLQEYQRGKTKVSRMVLPYASQLADSILQYLRSCKAMKVAEPLGSLRRQLATIGDIDIAVSSEEPDLVIEHFVKYPSAVRVLEKGPRTCSILVSGNKQIDLMVQPPKAFGSLLQHFTGSKEHNIALREFALGQGMSLSEYGIKYKGEKRIREYSSEENFYKALKLDWIPPELRENRGEILAASRGKLPSLVEQNGIKGDLHIHSNYDLEPSHDLGRSPLPEIIKMAEDLGYEYVGISDHNPSITDHTDKEIVSIMKERRSKFEHIISSTKSVRIHLFIMLEVDILGDGSLALPEEAFKYVDAVIASIHSSFNKSVTEMTKRVLRGLAHPKVKILGHPTGRLLQKRDGYELDWEEVFAFCKERQKALEINAYPDRLDLPDTLVKSAVEYGVPLVIDTDSHESQQMALMRYGVAVARRGWATKTDIVNTKNNKEFSKWLLGV